MKVAVEYIKWLVEELARINRRNLDELIFTEEDIVLDIPTEMLIKWELTGLNNVDFITSYSYIKR